MIKLIRILQNAQKIDEKKIYVNVIKDGSVQDFIIRLNRSSQLFFKGVSPKNIIIGEYSAATETIASGNQALNRTFDGQTRSKKAGEPYNFLDTGDFFKTFKVKITGSDFVIEADTDKIVEDSFITEQDLLGLTEESKNELVKHIVPLFIEETRAALFAGV